LVVAQEADFPYQLALAFNILGDVERFEKDYARAQAAHEESLDRLRKIGAARDQAGVLHNLAHAHLHQDHLEQAERFFRESMAMQQDQNNAQGVAECLIGFGAMACVSGMPGHAVELLTAAAALGGKSLLNQWPAERMEYEHYLAAVRVQLTEQGFQKAQIKGKKLTMSQAIEYALSLPLLQAGPASKAQDKLGGLTRREREIAALIAQGQTNTEIARRLVLSKRTVEKHVANILSKLELDGRAQIVRWALERGLSGVSD
jgi:non-specific serine/threonine protein kinase